MASKSSKPRIACPSLGRRLSACLLTIAIVIGLAPKTSACPFCTALAPSLSQWQDRAAIAALVEVQEQDRDNQTRLLVHRALKGADRLAGSNSLAIELDVTAKPGSLLLVFGSGAPTGPVGELSWHAVAVNETSYGYFARIPSLKTPTTERLIYFIPFLEHADPLVAEDAYLEFGHAPFDDVGRVADHLPMARVRAWLIDPKVPQTRKGFYGLALGLAGSAEARSANRELLGQLIAEPDDDFRGGFDGLLGGYLLLAGTEGLKVVESRYLANPRAADGDLRHAQTALRFYWEYGREIPRARIAQASRHLLARGEFAESTITDLARWKDWSDVDQIAALYARPGFPQPATGRAVVGYLLACPEPAAAKALDRLRKLDPQGVTAAEEVLSHTTTVQPNAQ